MLTSKFDLPFLVFGAYVLEIVVLDVALLVVRGSFIVRLELVRTIILKD